MTQQKRIFRKSLKFLPFVLACCGVLALGSVFFSWPFAVGVLVVVASFGVSSLAIAWAASVQPKLVMSMGLGTYLLKVIVLFLVFGSIAATGWEGLRPMTFGVLAGTIVWITAQTWWTWRAKIPYVGE